MLQATYQPLSNDCPEWGEIAMLPWDSEIFGFPVADLRIRGSKIIAKTQNAFQQALENWVATNHVELVSSVLSGPDGAGRTILSRLGFIPVEDTLRITHTTLQTTDFLGIHVATFSKMPESVRLAEPSDQAEVERIAEQSFRTGRYHADPRFPHDLADRRYRYWMRNVFPDLGVQSRIYVTGKLGKPTGFFHVEVQERQTVITIIAIDRPFYNLALGYDIGCSAMNAMKESGIKRVTSKISVANTGVMNLAAHYGFRFSEPQVTFHWHAPNAPHLLTPDQVFVPS